MQKVLFYIGSFVAVDAIALLVFYHNTEQTFVSKSGQQTEIDTAQESTVTFGVVGDIMLSRNVAGKINQAKDSLLPFHNMDAFLSSNEFNFANLESPFSGRDDFDPSGSLIFNTPRANVEGLRKYFPIVTLATTMPLIRGKLGSITQNNIWTITAFCTWEPAKKKPKPGKER